MSEPISDEEVTALAIRFHTVYEGWAPSFGWDTQPESRVAWSDLPTNQRYLMATVVREVVAPVARARDEAIDALAEANAERERLQRAASDAFNHMVPPTGIEDAARWEALRDALGYGTDQTAIGPDRARRIAQAALDPTEER